MLDGVDIFRARFARFSFKRCHQGGRFAAHKRSAATVHSDFKIEAAAKDIFTYESPFPRLFDSDI